MVTDVIEHCYEKVKNSDKLFGRAELHFGQAALMLKLQQIYEKSKAGQAVDKEEIVAYLGFYDYAIPAGELEGIIGELSTESTDVGFAADEVVTEEALLRLSVLFPKDLYAQTGLNFQIGSILWYAAMDICPLVDLITEKPITFGQLFAGDGEALQNHVYGRFGFLSNQKPRAAGTLWGLPYVYDFLLAQGLISEELHTRTLKQVEEMKGEVINARRDELWKYDYVHAWPAPKSVDPAQFVREAQLFRRTFSERIGVKELVAGGFIASKKPVKSAKRVGRNEPCPCGSGKKYKKCCLNA